MSNNEKIQNRRFISNLLNILFPHYNICCSAPAKESNNSRNNSPVSSTLFHFDLDWPFRKTGITNAFEFIINVLALSIDPHTQYFSPHRTENFNINMSLSLEGIGAVLQLDEEYTKVSRLVAKGPADKAGELQPSDRIVAVGQGEDGEPGSRRRARDMTPGARALHY